MNKKIIFRDISNTGSFLMSDDELYIDMTCFAINSDHYDLLSYLNSKLTWFFIKGLTPELRGGYARLKRQFVEQLPIPVIQARARKRLAALGEACTKAAREKFEIQAAVRRRILDLAPRERAKLTGRLEEWQKLDFAAFRAEIKRAFRADIPLKERGEWEAYLSEKGGRVRALSGEIASAEREIDAIVYALFELTPEEIALLESSLGGQY
jgi:hypothetical protein